MKLIFTILLLGFGSANAATRYSDYLACFKGLKMDPLGFEFSDGTNVVVLEEYVPLKAKMVPGYYIYTPDACYPLPKMSDERLAFFEIPAEKHFVYDTKTVGVDDPIFTEKTPPDEASVSKLADGDMLSETKGKDKLRAIFLLQVQKVFKRYESEKQLVEKDPFDDYINALETCAAVNDSRISNSAKKMIEKFKATKPKNKKSPAQPKEKETTGNSSG